MVFWMGVCCVPSERSDGMINVNELVDLAQRLDSVVDDSDSHVLAITFSNRGEIKCLLSLTGFLANFDSGDVSERQRGGWEIETEVEGVNFKALFYRDDLIRLRGFAPDAWIDERLEEKAHSILSIKKTHPHGNANERVEVI